MAKLEEVPDRIDALTRQILQTRAEMASEFSAVRLEIRTVKSELLHEIGSMYQHTMKEVMDRIDAAVTQLSGQMRGFQDEMRGFQDQAMSSLRAIHERLPPR